MTSRVLGWLTLVAALLPACDSAPLELFVDLRTDLAPGMEFAGVRVELTDTGARRDAVIDPAGAYLDGVRVAEFADLSPGQRSLVVTLVDESGATVAERKLRVDHETSFAVTVVITRDCRGVVCGDPDNETCIAGRCGSVACSERDPSACPEAECADDAECAAPSACAVGRCAAGACLFAADDALCAAEEVCDVEMGCMSSTPSCLDVSPADAVLWLDFEDTLDDGSAADRSGNGLDALCEGSCPEATAGWSGSGILLDGSTALRVPHAAPLTLDTGFTVSVFVEPVIVGPAAGYVAVALGDSGDNSILLGHVTGGQIVYWSDSTSGRNSLRGPTAEPGSWIHVVGTFDGATGDKLLYVNGTPVDATNIDAVDFDGHDLYIGADDDGGIGDFFEGTVDEVQVWNRALTEAEVQALDVCVCL